MSNIMSLNISDDVIKAALQEEIQAGIIRAMGDPGKVVKDAIIAMTDKRVNSRGEIVASGDKWNTKPYFEWLAQTTVENVVREEIEKFIDENKEGIAKEIREQLSNENLKSDIANSFIALILRNAKNEFKTKVNIQFEPFNGEI